MTDMIKPMRTMITLIAVLTLTACGQKEQAPANTPDTMTPTTAVTEAAPDVGKIKYGSVCAGCHGLKGQGQATFPKLTGQTADQIAAKLRDYKAGKKLGEQTAMMAPNAANLSDAEIEALAKHIAGLPQ